MLTINVFSRLCHLEPCVRDPSSLCSVGMTRKIDNTALSHTTRDVLRASYARLIAGSVIDYV